MTENSFIKINEDGNGYISKEQLSIISKTHKRKLTYLIDNNIIPCVKSGKKTRCYQILMDDAIHFINNMEEYLIQIPKGALSSKKKSRRAKLYYSVSDLNKRELILLNKYLDTKLIMYRDLITTKQVVKITGLSLMRIRSWNNNDKVATVNKNRERFFSKKV